VASVAGWILDDLISPYANLPVRLLVNLVVSVWVFYATRSWLRDLRGD
jgi:hypothetical protein